MSEFRDVIVEKPWGSEYLCYQNEFLAIWILHIKKDRQTSFHCHPNKNTGFIVLGGSAQLSFMRHSKIMHALDKIHIFRARFHATKAVSEMGAYVLEIETPVDKKDLVRLEDKYGRVGTEYEGKECYQSKTDECIWIEEPEHTKRPMKIADCKMLHIRPSNKEDLYGGLPQISYIVVRGGIRTADNKRIIWPGDIVDGESIEKLLKSFELIDGSTFIKVYV
jgi:hypothetical protein